MSKSNIKPVELWYTRCGSATASALAIRNNWLQAEFAQGGTVLHSLRESNDRNIRNSHFNHSVSGMFREGGNIPPIWARSTGQETVVVGITWLDEYQGILTRADSGIREIADLKGKRLGLPLHADSLIDFQRGAALHGFFTALGLVGLTLDDVKLIDVAGRDYSLQQNVTSADTLPRDVEALLGGEVDAIFIRYARGYRIAQDPRLHQVININDLKDPLLRVNNGTPRPITVDRVFLEQNPDVVARYLAVLLRTVAWAEQHPQEVLELLLPESGGKTTDDVIASNGPNVHFSFTPKLSAEYILGLQTQKNFLRDHGFLGQDFEISDWIVEEPLAAAKKLVEERSELLELPEGESAKVAVA